MRKRLPQPDELRVEQKKVVEYLLNSSHAAGSSKAAFFERFGFTSRSWSLLADALLEHGRLRIVVDELETKFGIKYVVECSIDTPDGRNPCIRSVWVCEHERPPRLITAYPNGQ
jgi:hypothetical protein